MQKKEAPMIIQALAPLAVADYPKLIETYELLKKHEATVKNTETNQDWLKFFWLILLIFLNDPAIMRDKRSKELKKLAKNLLQQITIKQEPRLTSRKNK